MKTIIENKLTTLNIFISVNDVNRFTQFPENTKIFSYLNYAQYIDGILTGFEVKLSISSNDKYNTIDIDIVKDEIDAQIDNILLNGSTKYVIGYKQPDISLQYELYQPYIKKLASEIYNNWNTYYEFDDIMQICNMVMVVLYNKGYYLNKYLLKRSIINYILCDLRKERDKPDMLSLESKYYGEGDSISIEETVIDKAEEQRRQDIEDAEYIKDIVIKKRNLIVDLIGQRQYDQLIREYNNKTVTHKSAMLLTRIKSELKSKGINSKSFYS